jgi:hypothetical protein
MGHTKTREREVEVEPKKIIEVDALFGIPDEEKTDEESPVIETEDEESEEVVIPDEEELNPFGDKW